MRGLRNLGIDCGKSGFLVVDEDRPGAFRGYADSLSEEIPATFAVRTSKGAHFYLLYLRQPEGEPLGNGRGKLAGLGIDVRGVVGFTVGPGSIHQTGVLYAPVDPSVPVAPVPAWLVAALRAPAPAPSRQGAQRPGFAYGRLRGAVATVVDAKEGERNNVLYWASCRLAEMISEGHLAEGEAVDILTRAGEAAGLAPVSWIS